MNNFSYSYELNEYSAQLAYTKLVSSQGGEVNASAVDTLGYLIEKLSNGVRFTLITQT